MSNCRDVAKLMSDDSLVRNRISLWLLCLLWICVTAWVQAHPESAANSDSPQEHFQSAQTFQLAGDYEKAAAEYRLAIARALDHLGNLYVSHDDFAAGNDLLARAVQIQPGLLSLHIDLGIAKFKAGDFEGAKSEAEAALGQDSHSIRALDLAGKAYFMQENYELAADRLQKALQVQPDFNIGYALALSDLELKKPTEAGIIFDEMLNSSKPSATLEALIGIAYRETGYSDQGISHLRRAVSLDPKSSRGHIALGVAYFNQGPGSYAAAQQQFQAGLAITPGDYTGCYYNGMIAASQKNFIDAAKWLDKAAATHPTDPDVYLKLGRIQFDLEHYEQSAIALKNWLRLAPQETNGRQVALVHELLGRTLSAMGKRNEADAQFSEAKQILDHPANDSQAVTAGPSRQTELRSILLQTSESTKFSLQENTYLKEISSLLGDAYDNLGVIDARSGRFVNAASEFGEAAHWNSGIQNLDKEWGMAAFRASQYDQAIAPLERQLRRTPGDLVLRETLGVCYFMTDKFAESASVFTPALDKLSSNPGVLYAAGVSLERSGNNKAASQLFSRMLKDNSNIPEVHLLLGEAHADLSEYQEALTEFSRALELDPRLAEVHYYEGIVRFKQGQMNEAAQEFQSELEINPKSAQAIYQLAVVRLAQHRTDEAISLLGHVVAQSPSNPDALYQLGKAMLEKGDAKSAIQNLEAAVHLQPRDYSYYQLSLAYRRDGREHDAQQALQMYEQLKRKLPPRSESAH